MNMQNIVIGHNKISKEQEETANYLQKAMKQSFEKEYKKRQ